MRNRRGYRRFQKEQKAVSPVVATLILILIAVAAAAALYLWLVAWQGGVTGGVGNPSAQTTVTIGGSTSVYPFSQLAVTQFDQNQSDIAVSLQQGGSGAGMLSVCAKNVDIGEASALENVAQLQTAVASGGYGCPESPAPVITTVAYDAVDMIVQSNNPHGLASIAADTILTIYIADGSAMTSGTAPGGFAFPMTNEAGLVTVPAITAGTGIAWDQIPACTPNVANCAGTTITEINTGITVGASTATCTGAVKDICATAGATPCGWAVCAGGSGTALATDPVQAWTRSDISGTTQSFTARILGIGDAAGTTSGLGFSGCSPNGQVSDCGINIPTAQQGEGNPGVIAGVAGHPDAIGYASDGLARASTSGVTFVGLQAVGQTAPVVPTTGSSGSIANGILGTGTTQYQGWRPFEYVTLGQPTGEVERFIQFVLQPQNNQNFATESAEVSIYSI